MTGDNRKEKKRAHIQNPLEYIDELMESQELNVNVQES